MAARAVLDHAAVAIGAELEILVTGGTARRPTVDDGRAARCRAVRLNCGMPSGGDGLRPARRPQPPAPGRTRPASRTRPKPWGGKPRAPLPPPPRWAARRDC